MNDIFTLSKFRDYLAEYNPAIMTLSLTDFDSLWVRVSQVTHKSDSRSRYIEYDGCVIRPKIKRSGTLDLSEDAPKFEK